MAIIYTEKGYGLHAKIHAAGEWLIHSDGQWIASDDAAVQALIDGYALDDAKSHINDAVVALATSHFNQAIAAYSPGELAGWPILRAEAEAYQADSTASTPNIAQEASIRGCDVPTLVQKVLANASYFDDLRAKIAGTSGKHRDAISALADFGAIAAYDFSTGWPGAK